MIRLPPSARQSAAAVASLRSTSVLGSGCQRDKIKSVSGYMEWFHLTCKRNVNEVRQSDRDLLSTFRYCGFDPLHENMILSARLQRGFS
jgi:uncharacterized ferritin-like protein (DUF455 family)